MKNWISGFGDQIDGVVAENDDMGLGALQALKEAKVKRADRRHRRHRGRPQGRQERRLHRHQRCRTEPSSSPPAWPCAKIARGEQVDTKPVYLMPEITTRERGHLHAARRDAKDAFLASLPQLIEKNLKTGDIANEDS